MQCLPAPHGPTDEPARAQGRKRFQVQFSLIRFAQWDSISPQSVGYYARYPEAVTQWSNLRFRRGPLLCFCGHRGLHFGFPSVGFGNAALGDGDHAHNLVANNLYPIGPVSLLMLLLRNHAVEPCRGGHSGRSGGDRHRNQHCADGNSLFHDDLPSLFQR
jgi:hypothetical protein